MGLNDDLPDGLKVNPGEIGVGLGQGAQKGRIVLVLTSGQWASLDPQQAVAIGKDLIDKAVAMGTNVQIELPRAKVTQANHDMLVQRYKVVLRKKLIDGIKPEDVGYLAERLVDTAFNTVG
jgi:hypothetical protein